MNTSCLGVKREEKIINFFKEKDFIFCLKSKYKFENMAFTKLKSAYKQRTGNDFEESDYESFGIVDAVDDKEFTGGLINLLQDTTDFITNNSKKPWKVVLRKF